MCQMRIILLSILLLVTVSITKADDFDNQFAIVFITEKTEAKYGSVPLKRELLADAINEIAKAGAKGIVVKFFLDREKDYVGDQLLADAISGLPVILQARIDNDEVSPNILSERFTLPIKANTSIEGNSGWIPALRFSSVAYDIGFADYDGFPLPLVENYKGRIVKSLFLSAIELAIGAIAIIEPGQQATIGHVALRLNSLNQVSVDLQSLAPLQYIPFHDVLETENWVEKIKGKVVILGYDGPKIHKLKTTHGFIPAHRLYVHVLKALLQDGT